MLISCEPSWRFALSTLYNSLLVPSWVSIDPQRTRISHKRSPVKLGKILSSAESAVLVLFLS